MRRFPRSNRILQLIVGDDYYFIDAVLSLAQGSLLSVQMWQRPP
jgi:hypothetical protein